MTRFGLLFVVLSLGGVGSAQQSSPYTLPTPARTDKRVTADPQPYERETAFKHKFEGEAARRREAEQELESMRAKLAGASSPSSQGASGGAAPAPSAGSGAWMAVRPSPAAKTNGGGAKKAATGRNGAGSARTAAKSSVATVVAPMSGGAVPLVLAVSAGAALDNKTVRETAVPLGSYVKAKVLTGVEANTLEAYPMLLQLEYAFVGPNETRIDLSHCFMIAKTKANLSTERVLGETQHISCVRENNEVVERPAKGYVADGDNTFGMTGQLISNQGRVLMASVIAHLAKGAGEAVALAQTGTQVVSGLGGTAQATNVTGSKLAYIAGKSVAEPATTIAEWYLNYAKQLVPSIAVGSGRDVWIVLLDTVRVPELSSSDG